MLRSNATGNLVMNRGLVWITAGRLVEDFGITTLTDVDYTFISSTTPMAAVSISKTIIAVLTIILKLRVDVDTIDSVYVIKQRLIEFWGPQFILTHQLPGQD